jgi:hypothetical protein
MVDAREIGNPHFAIVLGMAFLLRGRISEGNENQIRRRRQTDHGEHDRHDNAKGRYAYFSPPASQIPDQANVAASGDQVHNHANDDQGDAKSDGDARTFVKQLSVNGLQLAQEHAEPSQNKTKRHEGDSSAYPGQVGSLRRHENAGIIFRLHGGILSLPLYSSQGCVGLSPGDG